MPVSTINSIGPTGNLTIAGSTVSITTSTVVDFSAATSGLILPRGTTAQRPASPSNGHLRFNTETNLMESWNSTAGWSNIGVDLTPFTQHNTQALAHNIVTPGGGTGLIGQGSTRISTYGSVAPTVPNTSSFTSGEFGSHGGHSGANSYPTYWAFYNPVARPVNQLRIWIHSNSWGYFFLEGSNDSTNSGNFATTGNWTRLTMTSTTYPVGNENMGGFSSGYGDGTSWTYTYANNTPYLAYRITMRDASRGNQALNSYLGGAAGYAWQFNRV
jgi:hypothetical protein